MNFRAASRIFTALLIFGSIISATDASIPFYGKITGNNPGCYAGAFAYYAERTPQMDWDFYEANSGRHMSSIMFYQAWGSTSGTFPSVTCESIRSRNSIPHIVWEPWKYVSADAEYSLQNITSGNFDAYITAWATAAKNYRYPIFLRFAHEMNGDWYPWCGAKNSNDVSKYIAAWKHVYDIFKGLGADNVTWVWCPNADSVPSQVWNSADNYYPGDQYVDWIGIDGYNWGTSRAGSSWQTFDQIFTTVYSSLTASHPSKPFMLGEFACSEVGGSKPDWTTDAFGRIKTNYPAFKAFNWFNQNKETNWYIESSDPAKNSFKAALTDEAYYKGRIYFPAVTMISPNGGELWRKGTTREVAWTATYEGSALSSEGLSIFYSTDGGSTYPNVIASGLSNSGAYIWTVPTLESTSIKIKISSSNQIGNISGAVSENNFSISSQPLTYEYSSSGVSISIPSGAAQITPVITADVYFNPSGLGPYPAGRTVGGSAIEFRSTVTSFLLPITITMTVPAGFTDAVPYFWDAAANAWSSTGLTVTARGATTISFTTTHLSVYAVFGISGSLLNVAVYPNPFRTGSSAGVVFDGLTGNETVRIFTIAGETVTAKVVSSGNSWTWDARNSSGNNAAQGIYIFVITSPSGQKRIGKIAVIN